MNNKPNNQYGLWTSGVIAVVCIALYVTALVMLERQKDSAFRSAVELANETQREELLHSTEGLLEGLADEMATLDAFFYSPDEAVGVIEKIEGLSVDVGAPVSVADVRLEDDNSDTGASTLSTNVASSGSWRSMTHLLALLDTLPFNSNLSSARLVVIDSGEADSNAQWSLQALLHVSLRR